MHNMEKEISNLFSNVCSVCGHKEFIIHYNNHCCIHCKSTEQVIKEYWERVARFGLYCETIEPPKEKRRKIFNEI